MLLPIVEIMSNSDLKFTLRSIVDKNKLNGTKFIDWERNLRIVLRSEGREDVLETPSNINVIEILTTTATTWVLDTGCCAHITSNVHGLRNRRQVEKGEIDLRVANKATVRHLL